MFISNRLASDCFISEVNSSTARMMDFQSIDDVPDCPAVNITRGLKCRVTAPIGFCQRDQTGFDQFVQDILHQKHRDFELLGELSGTQRLLTFGKPCHHPVQNL